MKKCPYCLREISDTAIICKYCRKKIESKDSTVEIPWGLKDLLLIFIMTIISYYIIGFIIGFILMLFGLERNTTRLIVNNLFYIIFCIAIFLNIGVVYNREIFKSLALQHPKKLSLFFIPIIAVGLFYFFKLFPEISKEPPMGQYLVTKLDTSVHIIAAVMLAPFTEEIVWRGYIFPIIKKKAGIAVAIFSITIFFTLTHAWQLFGAWPILIKVFIGAFIFTIIRAVTNSTSAAILLHFSYNLIIALSCYFKF